METEYWLKRWRENRTGWHHDEVMPLLEKHWPGLGVLAGTRVLVPLCGKSLDMLWLSQQGLNVLGIEISPVAVEAFLAENHLHARTRATPNGTRYGITNPPGGKIEILNHDLFKVDTALIAKCSAFYDRAALIALPAATRTKLANKVYANLPTGSRGLLIVLDYPPSEMDGPPFTVDNREVHRLFDRDWETRQLERRDILAAQPHFREQGVTALHTAVYTLGRRDTAKSA